MQSQYLINPWRISLKNHLQPLIASLKNQIKEVGQQIRVVVTLVK